MKCETQCHMLCPKHPSFVLLFLGSQKLKANKLAVPIILPFWTNTFQTNPKNGKKKVENTAKKKKKAEVNFENPTNLALFGPHWSKTQLLYPSLSIFYLPHWNTLSILFLCTDLHLHFANRYGTGWSSLTYTPPQL